MPKIKKQDIKELLIICLTVFAIFLILSAVIVFIFYAIDSNGKSGWQLEDSINSRNRIFMFCVCVDAVIVLASFLLGIIMEKLGYKSKTYYLDNIATDVSKIVENIENENVRQTKENMINKISGDKE